MEDINTLKDIGNRIRTARKKNKLTMKELGSKVGLSESSISKYEKGLIGSIDINLIQKIANCLEVDVSELIPETYFSNKTDICLQPTTKDSKIKKSEIYIADLHLDGLSNMIYEIMKNAKDDEFSKKEKMEMADHVSVLVDEIVNNKLDADDIEKLTSDAKYMGKSKRKNIIYVKNPANTKIPKSGIETIEKRSKKSKKNNRD